MGKGVPPTVACVLKCPERKRMLLGILCAALSSWLHVPPHDEPCCADCPGEPLSLMHRLKAPPGSPSQAQPPWTLPQSCPRWSYVCMPQFQEQSFSQKYCSFHGKWDTAGYLRTGVSVLPWPTAAPPQFLPSQDIMPVSLFGF